MASGESKGPLHTLILGKHWPEPQSSAAGSRMMQLIEVLQALGSVSFASAAGRNAHSEDLTKHGVQEFTIQINDPDFDEFVADLKPDIVVFDRFMTEEQFGWRVTQHVPQALRVLDTEDIHGLRQARYQAVKEHRAMTNHDLLNETMLRELAAIYRCDLSLIISEAEVELLQHTLCVPKELLHYLPFLVNSDEVKLQDQLPEFGARSHFVTIGNMMHAPNRDAVEYLSRDVWPLIQQKLPQAEMHVYGAYTDDKIQAMHQPRSGFHIKGRAEDAALVVEHARVCLAPLRFGAGLKGKLLESMMCGTPSVTTDVGVEGMNGSLAWAGCVANTPGEIASAAIQLYTDEELWKKSQQQGFYLLNLRFNAAQFSSRLIETLEKTLTQLEHHRLKNVTGQVLYHQSLRSTEYMSRWISAKNSLKNR